MKIKEIIRRGRKISTIEIRVGELDKSKCSYKFLQHNFSDDVIVNVKVYENGELDLRGAKNQYRIIQADNRNYDK